MEFCSKMHLKVVTVCHCEPPLLFFGGEAIPHFVEKNSILKQSLLLHELEIASMPSQSLRHFAMTLFYEINGIFLAKNILSDIKCNRPRLKLQIHLLKIVLSYR